MNSLGLSLPSSLGRRGKVLAAMLLALGAVVFGSLFTAQSANAAYTPYATNIYSGPSYYTYLHGSTLSGWYVRMNCWTDSYVWSYGTNRWFHITTTGWNPRTGRLGSMSGFVSANRVAQQNAVGHC